MQTLNTQPDSIETQRIPIDTPDGYQLSATLYTPELPNDQCIIINGATGVLRKYYHAFAKHLSQYGFVVLTYDYRGIGDTQKVEDSAPSPTMLHWGQRDMDAVLNFVQGTLPEYRILGVGHSIGGQLLGVVPDNHRYHAYLNVASQHIHWRNWPIVDQPLTALFFFGVLPLFTTFTGGLPKWVLGSEYLPKQVAKDWSRFGRKKAWIADEKGKPLREGYRSYRGKMRFLAMKDDRRFAPPACVERLAQEFTQAPKDVKVITPSDYGMKRIDHFGFFQKHMNRSAWDDCANWFLQS